MCRRSPFIGPDAWNVTIVMAAAALPGNSSQRCPISESSWQSSRGDADLARSILDGKGKTMPRMKDKLVPVLPLQMVAFIRAFRGGKQVVGEEPAPEEVLTTPPVADALRSRPFPLAPVRVVVPALDAAGKLYRRILLAVPRAERQGRCHQGEFPHNPGFHAPEWQAGAVVECCLNFDSHSIRDSPFAGGRNGPPPGGGTGGCPEDRNQASPLQSAARTQSARVMDQRAASAAPRCSSASESR